MPSRTDRNPYVPVARRWRAVTSTAALAACVLLAGMVLSAMAVTVVAKIGPGFARSTAGDVTIVVMTLTMNSAAALFAAWNAARRLKPRVARTGRELLLMAGAGPMALIALISALALATSGLPWWRPLVDLLLVAACCAIGTVLRAGGADRRLAGRLARLARALRRV
ncbi:hypothetical protein [Actinomadura sp. HBU206391]|uniref:hypothetical protein n=1 Tax=Actinomadura sp. HBU206391 TaxID=2731692 RepID=UPI00164F952F|nr:hypothetical protein [Actinomadura sp. HBU206391]MBC6456971.1 hypothetical protein [Actinomadura sp. HBU206391]